MAFLIGGANSDSGAYQIDNSLRFSDSNYLTIDNTDESGEGVNFTLSVWLKMTSYAVGGYQGIFSVFKDSNDYFEIYKDNSERLQICLNINGTNVCYQNQGFEFRDYSAWYHLVVSFNNSASGEVNKIKVYINGTEISASEGVTNSNPFADMGLGDSAYDTRIGAYRDNTSATWNGYMAELHLVAGTTLTASSFGETDDNGVWIPIKYTGSYGENGFFLEFQETGTSQNASGMGADTSGNVNHLAVTGLSSVDVTTDTPTNNFATLNILANRGIVDSGSKSFGATTYSEGNLKAVATASNTAGNSVATFGSSMPFYFEVKITSSANHNNDDMRIGVVDIDHASGNAQQWVSYYSFDGVLVATGESNNTGNTSSGDGHIIGVACDFTTNNTVTFYHNGTSQGAMAVGATYRSLIPVPWIRQVNTNTWEANFGNSPFSISSGNADENGYGNFEYAVPSGYYALCTKNLAEYG